MGSDVHIIADEGEFSPILPTFRIRNSADVLVHFQAQLNKFPRELLDGKERIKFVEFGAYLIRPKGENKNQLTHIVFPETVVGIPDSEESLKEHTSTTFPQVMLMADAERDELYLKVITHRINEEQRIESSSLMLTMDEAFFISDIWEAIAIEDKLDLQKYGFGPGMTSQQWAQAINSYQAHIKPIIRLGKDKPILLRELPILIARTGAVGTNGSWHMLPEFILYALNNNRFIYDEEADMKENPDDIMYEFGDVHIHSLVNPMTPGQREIADIVGENVIRRNPSPADIFHYRSSESIAKKVGLAYGNRAINAIKTIGGIITVDEFGVATGSRWLDFYHPDFEKDSDFKKIAELADRASEYQTPQIIAEYYAFVDKFTTEDFGTDEGAPHVGDPDYNRSQDPDVGYTMSKKN